MSGPGRVSGLDGLRGLAVALVVVFHVYPDLLPGGFLGVDVFFVLSGYLITGLLVRGLSGGASVRVALRGFWLGRAARLLPELATVLVAVCVTAAFAAPEFGAGLRAQVAAATVSGTNWLLIAHDQNYFAAFAADAGHPAAPALQHLWSLAVEEQFYLVWPLLLCVLLRADGTRRACRNRRNRRQRRLPLLLLAAAAGSFTLMAAHAGTGSSDYYNTLTHCGGLLLGAAAAFRLPLHRLITLDRPPTEPGPTAVPISAAFTATSVATATFTPSVVATLISTTPGLGRRPWISRPRGLERPPDPDSVPLSPRKLQLLGRCGLGGLIVLVVLSVCLRGDTTAPERGGILLAAVATLPVLPAAACAGTDVARMLTWRPAVYLGVRSYGVYLWHWPLIVLLGAPASVSGLRGQLLRGGAELILPVVLAALSRRLVTLPAQRLTRAQLRAALDRLLGRAARPWPARLLAGLAAAVLLPALFGLGQAARADPDQAALQAQIAAGSAVAAGNTAGGTTSGTAAGAATSAEAVGLSRAPASALVPITRSGQLPPAGVPDPVLGEQTTAIGDSVLLAGAQALAERLPGIVIDAKVGRQAYEAPDRISMLADEGRLRHFVIVALGTNGDFTDALLDEFEARIGPGRVLVLMTVHVPRSWQDEDNALLTGYAATHPGTVLVDWNATVSPYPDLLWPDATHPRPSGAEVYADLLAYDLGRVHE